MIINNIKRILQFVLLFLLILGIWVAIMPADFTNESKINDKLIHFIVFFCFAVLADAAIEKANFWLWKGLPLFFYGTFIELLQHITPYREFSVFDLMADFMGILVYFILQLCVLAILFMKNRTGLNSAKL